MVVKVEKIVLFNSWVLGNYSSLRHFALSHDLPLALVYRWSVFHARPTVPNMAKKLMEISKGDLNRESFTAPTKEKLIAGQYRIFHLWGSPQWFETASKSEQKRFNDFKAQHEAKKEQGLRRRKATAEREKAALEAKMHLTLQQRADARAEARYSKGSK